MQHVSHETFEPPRLCSKCSARPAKPGQSYCRECHRDYMKAWRAGTIERRLTPDEWALIQRLRAEAAAAAAAAARQEREK
jgi:hypothetical protein